MERQPRLINLANEAERIFEEKYGRPPRWIVAAPGRVNLIGEHTDYNDGFVFPMAIDRHVVIAADRSTLDGNGQDGTARLFSTELNESATIAVEGPISPGEVTWSSYLQGAVAGCLAAELAPGGFDAVVHSDVPVGGGLSSSAALEVATATLVEAMTERRLDPVDKVLLCQKAEHEYARMPCGIMDQFSSVMGQEGHLMLLDCRTQTARMIPLADPDVVVLIVNTNVKHELTGGEYAERRGQCEEASRRLGVAALRDATLEQLDAARLELDDVHFRRAHHVISEIGRTLQTADAIRESDWATVGQLMYASHASLRDDYEVSCAELDVLVEIAASIGTEGGVIGSRMTGGGFGGCTVSLIRREAIDAISQKIHETYVEKTGIEPTIFCTQPTQGAHVVKNGPHKSPVEKPCCERESDCDLA